MDICGFQPGPINQLPNEILKEIFQYMPTSDLLRSFRLVCQTWYPIATSLCRKRLVKVKIICDSDSVSGHCLNDIFKNDTDLPWSAMQLVFGRSTIQQFCGEVCESFAANIQLVDVNVDTLMYDKFVRALITMPNIQELQIWYNSSDSANFVFPPRGKVQLPKLKHLQIEYGSTYQSPDLLEFILVNTGAPLNSLKIVYLGESEIEESDFNRMAQIICASNIEKLSLGLPYDFGQFPIWNILAEQLSSRMYELEIDMGERESYASFHHFEHCLAKFSGLRTLILSRFEEFCNGKSILQFPTLGHLENLEIRSWEGIKDMSGSGPGPEYRVFSINPIKATNFPNLKTVRLQFEDYWPLSMDIRMLFESSDVNQFNSVEFLDVGNYHGEGKLSSIFPKLLKISAAVDDSKYLSPIFDDMMNVIEVDLTLCSDSDNNVLLLQAVRFLRQLKKLNKLTVRNSLDGSNTKTKVLEDIGLTVLTMLHPVNLEIQAVKVTETDDIVGLLRTRHPQLQLLRK